MLLGGYCKTVKPLKEVKLLKAALFSALLLSFLLLSTTFISCAGGAGSASGGAAAEGASLAIQLPDTSRTIYEKADIVSFTVTISSGSFNSTKTANKGETMLFSNLPAGNYSVKAYGKTSTGAVAAKCETSVTIVAGETTSTTLHLSRIDHWTVTFMNADDSTHDTQDISDGYKATKPADPAPVSGKLFSGWTTDAVPADSSPLFDFNTPITGDKTLKPVFGVITYTVKYVSAAGDFADVSFTAATASDYELPSTSGVAGLTFDNWYSDANFTTSVDASSVRDITTFTKKDDIHYEKTIYAKWTAHVEFQGESSTGAIITLASDEDVTYGSKVSNPGTPTAPTGATFGGWYTGTFNAGTGKVTLGSEYDFNTAVTGDMILYAKWNYVMHNVTYISEPQDVPAGTATEFREIDGIPTLPSFTPEADSGLTFVGWTDDENFTLDTTPLPSVPANTTEDVTLYAIWKVQVIMNPNNGTDAATQYDVIYNKTFNESVPSPIPDSMATGLTKTGTDSYVWYKTSSSTLPTTWPAEAFDKTAPITEKTYLHAKWLYKDFTGTLADFLAAEFVPNNTADTAYNIVITDEVLTRIDDLVSAVKITSSNYFKGVYIKLDLSACTATSPGNYGHSMTSHDCKYLVEFKFPSGITTIPGSMFRQCSNLRSISAIPDTVTEIGGYFCDSSKITGEVVIPASCTKINGAAFIRKPSGMTIRFADTTKRWAVYKTDTNEKTSSCNGVPSTSFLTNSYSSEYFAVEN